jgi:hypothetical protein
MPSRRLTATLTALTITLSLGLSGCGGDDSAAKPKTTPSQPVITGPGSTPSVNLETGTSFVGSLAANTQASLTRAAALTAPKSAASRYVARTAAALGSSPAPLKLIDKGEGRYRLCQMDGTCTVIDQLVLLSGKVVTFKVDGKQLR